VLAADEGGQWDERSRAARFLILTASRTGNVAWDKRKSDAERQDGDWSEIDLVRKVWTIPRVKMKVKKDRTKPHIVPLSPEAIRLLGKEPASKAGPLFPNTTMADLGSYFKKIIKAGDYRDPEQHNRLVTPHGFRTTLTGWAADDMQERYSFEAQEFALDHGADMNKVQKVYHRNKRIAQRVLMMRDWARYATTGKFPPDWLPPEE
jgi:integrase